MKIISKKLRAFFHLDDRLGTNWERESEDRAFLTAKEDHGRIVIGVYRKKGGGRLPDPVGHLFVDIADAKQFCSKLTAEILIGEEGGR